ncbi:MAG: dienelactone hydrolase family protein [Nitrospinales bacterium]
MPKKCLILILLILGFTFQISFAENIKFKSTRKGTDGKLIVLTGILTKPDGDGPFPAVVFLHGCAGLEVNNNRDIAWVNQFVKWGYVTLQVDSLKPRGLSNICTDRDLIVRMLGERAQDANDAKSYLAKLSFVDRNRIAVLGWSHGGTTILDVVASIKRDISSFKAAIAFYPYCYKTLYNLNSPILILIGEKDDWCPADLCSKNMPPSETEHEAILKIYPGAYHDFDSEGVDEVYEGHMLRYDQEAAEDAINQVKSFLAKHLK